MLGILLIDKTTGMTSHDVVDVVRRKFGTRRVGHAGTLDPLASGLLVVAVGPATRFLQYLPLEPKRYLASVRFGRATTTYDEEGETSFEGVVPTDLKSAVEAVLPRFRGLLEQLPPMYSAIKLNGKPLYTYARKGEEVERRPRTVRIDDLIITESTETEVTLDVQCSGGTYVRSLAHDIGQALGCGAYLAALQRTGVGRFALPMARKLEEIDPAQLIPLEQALEPMPVLRLDEQATQYVQDGRVLHLPPSEVVHAPLVSLMGAKGRLIGVGRTDGDSVKPECVLPREVTAHV